MNTEFNPLPDAPLLLFGGPYSNLEALQALLDEADELGVPACNLLCTGDAVAYCADARDTLALLRERGVAVVQGNCEAAFGAGADDCGCGFESGSACDLLSVQWYRHARVELDADACRWMAALPTRIRFEWGGVRWLALHGGATANNRFLFHSDTDQTFRDEFPDDVEIVFGGHSGLPFSRQVDTRLWHNAGAIGMPANDGTPRTWFSVARRQQRCISISTRALHYDALRAQSKMRQRGLPGGYADALTSGLWPSLDVLPPAERLVSGVNLMPQCVAFSLAGAELVTS